MAEAMMALEVEKTELVHMVLDFDDMELVKKARAALKHITTLRKDPFFTDPVNLEYFRRSVGQRENGEVIELASGLQKELSGLRMVMS